MSKKPFAYVVLSAALFGISSPIAKLLLKNVEPVVLAGLLYLGAFLGLFLFFLFSPTNTAAAEAEKLGKKDLPWLAGAVLAGGVLGPIFQMLGLTMTSGFSVSLLLNLEGVATAFIAVVFFKENAGPRLWAALAFMTAAGVLLSWDPTKGVFSILGPLLILLAVTGWGIDNNFTRQISDKNPIQITCIKGLAGGIISLSIALVLGNRIPLGTTLVYALLLGAMSYGISLVLFIKSLKGLGSSRTGAFFSLGPFIGAVVSVAVLREWSGWAMLPAFVLMASGVWLIVSERHTHAHTHRAVVHNHVHGHADLHHLHVHEGGPFEREHCHEHVHEELTHVHAHWPDALHRHAH